MIHSGLLHLFKRPTRKTALLITFFLCLFSILTILINRGDIQENVSIMLPSGQDDLLKKMIFLQSSPLADKVFILLEAQPEATKQNLKDTSLKLIKNLPKKYFPRVLGADSSASPKILSYFTRRLPYLLDPRLLKEVEKKLNYQQVKREIKHNYDQLSSTQGLIFKDVIRQDPINLRGLILSQIKSMMEITEIDKEQGYILSRDGHSALITAQCSVDPTDSKKSQVMLKNLEKLHTKYVPENIKYSMVSVHAYSAANSRIIQHDMQQVLILSLIGLSIIFVVFLRNIHGLWVLSVPICTLFWAIATYCLAFSNLSGIVLGFGAVLLGITLDFGVHVYFCLAENKVGTDSIKKLSRPLVASALTTCSGFLVLYFSSISGIRQLSFLAVSGIIFACLFSLFVLPSFMNSSYNRFKSLHISLPSSLNPFVWICLLLLMATLATHLQLDMNLRSVGYFPEQLQNTENKVQKIWGNFKKNVMLVTSSTKLQESLRLNDKLYQSIQDKGKSQELISISPIFPAQKTQKENFWAWKSFWTLQKKKKVKKWLYKAGDEFGFNKKAFQPFLRTISNDYEAEKINLDELNTLGLSGLVDLFISLEKGQSLVYSYPQKGLGEKNTILDQVVKSLNDTYLLSGSNMQNSLGKKIKRDLSFYAFLGLVVIGGFLFLIFRSIKDMFWSFLPPLSAVLVLLGVFGFFSIKLNIFHVAAIPLIIGLGVDYGLFMLYWKKSKAAPSTPKAVIVSALSTIMAFGVLTWASHPALHSLGLAVLIGVFAAAVCALLVTPQIGENK